MIWMEGLVLDYQEQVVQNMQLNTICFVSSFAPSLKAPYAF